MIPKNNRRVSKAELERYLLIFEPHEYLPKFVRSARDIYELRSILKSVQPTDFVIAYLAHIILSELKSGRRFRKVDCIRLLRRLIRDANFPAFSSSTVSVLFEIYKALIFNMSEKNQWAVSVLIKGQKLSDDEIEWLIENYRKSEHVVNRLLLYPVSHPLVVEWAKSVYKAGEFSHRESEVIALLINNNFVPAYVVDRTDSATILKAIARARICKSNKEILMREFLEPDNYRLALDLALKMNMPVLVHYMLKKLDLVK